MNYQEKKEAARAAAIGWQAQIERINPSWGELYEAQVYFTKLARRYGLTREFRNEA